MHSSWLVIVAIVLGIVGVVAKGLLYLLIIGIVVFLGALRMRRVRQAPGQVKRLYPRRARFSGIRARQAGHLRPCPAGSFRRRGGRRVLEPMTRRGQAHGFSDWPPSR